MIVAADKRSGRISLLPASVQYMSRSYLTWEMFGNRSQIR